MTASFAYADHD